MKTWEEPADDLSAAELAARAARAAVEAVSAAERLQARARFALTVSNIATAVAQRIELREMAAAVLEQTMQTLGAVFAHVLIADEERRELRLLDGRNLDPELSRCLTRFSFDATLISARAATTQTAQLVTSPGQLGPDLHQAQEMFALTGLQTLVSLPLVARGRLIGVLTFGLPRTDAFSPQDADALNTCAEIFAVGLANSLAYENERALRSLFEGVGVAAVAISSSADLHTTLNTIASQARAVVGAEHAVLQLDPGLGPECPGAVHSGAGAAAAFFQAWPSRAQELPAVEAALRLNAHQVAELRERLGSGPGIDSVLAVAVSFQEKRQGTIYLFNKPSGEFTREDERAIALLATFVGATLHQAHLRGQVESQRARVEAIVTYAPHPILYVDAGTQLLVANPRAVELLGDLELSGRSPARIGGGLETPEGDTVEDEDHPFLRALRGECVRSEELVLFARDGKRIPCLVSAAPVAVAGGATTGAILTFEDITAFKQLERMRDEWASIISHDLGQPLHLLAISIELMKRILERSSEAVPPRVLECLQSARGSIFVLKRLSQDLTEASRLETHRLAVQRRPVDVLAVTAEQVERLKQLAEEHVIRLTCGGPLPSLLTDPVRVEQILGNLVQNALKYSLEASEIEVRLERRDREVLLEVSNEGPGIAPEELPHLFERFYRTRAVRAGMVRGAGLGLYIVKGLAEALGGRIEVESILGQRTSFRVFLPVDPAPAALSHEAASL
jgi:PAS domain S-box-containing protein